DENQRVAVIQGEHACFLRRLIDVFFGELVALARDRHGGSSSDRTGADREIVPMGAPPLRVAANGCRRVRRVRRPRRSLWGKDSPPLIISGTNQTCVRIKNSAVAASAFRRGQARNQ